MRLVIFTEPQQGATYDDLRRVAQTAEAVRLRRLLPLRPLSSRWAAPACPGPTDAWVTLAGLAVQTSRIRLGTLVTSATFRLPGPLAIAVAQVDAMSGGRVELGLGGGWFETEHTAYGIPFPPVGERFDRLEEQLEIITGLLDHAGRPQLRLRRQALPAQRLARAAQAGAVAAPAGHRRRPGQEAHACPGGPLRRRVQRPVRQDRATSLRPSSGCVRRAARSAGRHLPAFSAAAVLCVGRDDAEVRRRAAAIGAGVEEIRAKGGVVGTPGEAVETIKRYAEAGAARLFLQTMDLHDLDHIELVASEIAPHL